MYDITIEIDPPYAAEVDATLLETVAQQVLQSENLASPLDMSVWITNEDELHSLNRTYRGKDSSTDVLSFGDDDASAPFIFAPQDMRHLGDIAISYPHVVRQAQEQGHSRRYELVYLLAHGVLHLLGYDHEEDDEALVMRTREEVILGALGITREAEHADTTP